MANKYLDLAGLEHLWDKIEAEVSTAADNAKAEAIASAAADATTKANNALDSAKTDTDNKLKSYLPLSGTATAAIKLSNTTAIGSATQPVYFSADGVPVPTTYTLGASVPSGAVFTDEKVKLTAVAPASNTYYYPVMHSATTGTTSLVTNSGIKIQTVTGTTSVIGFNQLVLGNNTASGTAGNQYGQITLYSSGTNGHTIIPASGTSNVNHTLPAATGTILNTGTTSFTQTLTSGTEVGKIKINGTTTTLYAPTNTDEKVSIEAAAPSTATTYYPVYHTDTSGTSTKLKANDGFTYRTLEGTTSANGFSVMVVGNGKATGTSGNKYGIVRIYGKNTYCIDITPSDTLSASRSLTLPNGNGRLALASEITDEKVKLTTVTPTSTTKYYPALHSATSGTTSLSANDSIRFNLTTGTATVVGSTELVVGNATASGTVGNQSGRISIYGDKSTYSVILPSTGTAVTSHTLPSASGTLLNTGTTSFTQTLTSGTEVGKIKINGTTTTLYAPTNTDTHFTTGLKVGASATATANAAATNGNVYLNVLDNTTVRDSHNIVGSGATTVTSDANGKITISSTNTTYNAATTSANGLMSSTDKSKLDYTNVAYANCSTAAGTAEKVATISGNSNWKLTQGSIVTVYYNTSNTASSVTLNVNNTGAKEIYYGTAKYTGNSTMICGAANRCITYMYSGAYWVWISSGMDNNTTYSAATSNALGLVKVGSNITNTSGTISLTKANVTAALGYTPPTTNTTYSAMKGATASAAGTAGLVPAPAAGKQTSFLRGDGTWQVPPNTKVTQTPINSSNTGNYPLLLAPTGQTATATTTANFASTLYYTPSNHTIVSKDLPLNFSSATTDISAANVSINGTASQVQLTGAKGVVLTSGDEGDIAINGMTHIEGNLTANNFITGTKTITLSSATAFGQANLTTTDLGFEPTASTTIVVSLRRSYSPAPAHFNVYAHFFKASSATAGMICLLISNGASGQTNVPAGTYYVDYIVTNNA